MKLRSVVLAAAGAIIVAVLALALVHNRGGSVAKRAGADMRGNPARLTIANYAFAPGALTLRAGATVTVVNDDSTAHTATAGSGAFDSGTLKPGQSAHFTLEQPGTYSYICQFHAFMTGTIKVVR